MKTKSKIIAALSALLITGGLMAEQQPTKFSDRLLLEFGAKALVPLSVPTGIGGGPTIGLAFRDFNLFFKPTVLIAEPTSSTPKNMLTPTIGIEVKFVLMPNFLTLLPYLDAGVINTKVKRADGTLSSSAETAPYGEVGVGLDIQLTNELSVIPRIGVGYGYVISAPDSNNNSGTAVSLAMRYTFGRPASLDY